MLLFGKLIFKFYHLVNICIDNERCGKIESSKHASSLTLVSRLLTKPPFIFEAVNKLIDGKLVEKLLPFFLSFKTFLNFRL